MYVIRDGFLFLLDALGCGRLFPTGKRPLFQRASSSHSIIQVLRLEAESLLKFSPAMTLQSQS